MSWHRSARAHHRAWLAMALLVLPAAIFVWLTTVRLDAQGLYYDELHQATAAFTYLGSPPEYFARAPVYGIPLLNMPYSGAIKTAVYGLYLRFVRPEFSVVSWRLVGIVFVAVGLIVFGLLARPTLSPVPLAVVLGLLITDQTVLLGTRHDWGPIALALALRLTLIATWLRGERSPSPSPRNTLALGALVGLMTFEKLSSWVMLIALAAILLPRRRHTAQHLVAAVVGVLIGALPLVVVNAWSFLNEGHLVSVSDMGTVPERSWLTLLGHAWGYIGLGAGDYVWRFILGSPPPRVTRTAEPFLLTFAVMLAGTVVLFRLREPSARCALTALACYVTIGIALYLFPRKTGIHHWVLGTPFHYVAIGLALESIGMRIGRPTRDERRATSVLLAVAVAALLTVRAAGVISVERALWRGAAGRAWHPSLTQLGRFAAARADEAIFIAADWGVATQIYCLSNGRPGLVHQPLSSYQGPSDLLRLQQRSRTRILYAVSLNPTSRVNPAATERIFRDLAATPYWRETAVDPEVSSLGVVTVRKFLYDPRPAVGG